MSKGKTRRIEIMDTTLRDGEQAEGISMMPEEKRTIAQRLLESVKVDRIEVASARVSEGERRAVKAIIDYAESKVHDRASRFSDSSMATGRWTGRNR
jgi:D-citramalate synthase